MKETLYYFFKNVKRNFRIVSRRFKRVFIPQQLTEEDSFHIPIVINNRNRYTFLKQLVDWLKANGYTNIHILDNDSSYGPLLKYYDECGCNVHFLKRNAGYQALWQTEFFRTIERSWYVYTDSDVLPTSDCPSNVVWKCFNVLKAHRGIEKVGPALKIDDLPDFYENKDKVIAHESQMWLKPIADEIYDAQIDTTFALYKPFAQGNAEECPALRIGGNFVFRHQPWYENSSAPTEEDLFYRRSVAGGTSYWLNIK